MAHRHLCSPWFAAATADLRIVLPDFRLIPTFVGSQPYLSCSGSWSDEGEWLSLLAYGLPTNISGLRFCPPDQPLQNSLRRSIRFHVRHITDQLKLLLTRQSSSALYHDVASSALSATASKLAFMAQRLQYPGPPLHIFLDHFPLLSHRAAIASFLCGDWFLAKFAKNYYARNLLPKSGAHSILLQDAGVEERSVCLFCWHFRRVVALEDEFHVACVCPAYSQPRQDMLNMLPSAHPLRSYADLCHLLSLRNAASHPPVGSFFARARQIRRRHKLEFERLNEKFARWNFACKRAAWRLAGKYSCRHGVLFNHKPPSGCKCLCIESAAEDWSCARFMPAVCPEMKCIIAVPFDRASYQRLGTLQSRARQLGW